MGIDDKILGEITKKFGVSGDQAKAALAKIVPFVQGKLGSLGGGNVGLLSQIKSTDLLGHVSHDEKEAHVQEVAKETGLPEDQVRDMLHETAGILNR